MMDEARQKQIYRIKPGQTYWFEYRCLEAHHSAHAYLWYRSHQQVKVLKLEEPGYGVDEDARAAQGQPAAYKVQFQDGLIDTAMEDELLDSRDQFTQKDPPKKPIVKEDDVGASSLELASVLLEIDAKELARHSMKQLHRLDHGTIVITNLMTTIQIDEYGDIVGRDEKNIKNAYEIQDLIAQERNIASFNTREISKHYGSGNFDSIALGDIGYWMKDGTYVPPSEEYRGSEVQEAMTPKDLLIRGMGLGGIAAFRGTDQGKQVTIRHYQWINRTTYTVKIGMAEITQNEQVTGLPERRVPSIRIIAMAWVENTPSIYHEGGKYQLCDKVLPEKKGEVYARIWKMLHDIQAAQDAGMEADDMIKFLVDVLSQEHFASQPKES